MTTYFEAETETVVGLLGTVERLLCSASEATGVLFMTFVHLGRSKFELSSAHEKIGV